VTILADSVVPESPRQYFRRHLQCHTSKAADLTWYLDQSVPRFAGSAEVRLAVEELVDRLGDFLGFSTSRDEAEEYSRWSSATGQQFIVWTMDSARAVARVGAGSHARDRQIASIAVGTDDLLTCVYVVCGAVNERLLNEAVVLRRASRQVRLITVDALAALAGHSESGALAHDQVVTLLRPASALADATIALLSPPARRR
jgi:hypothetical protein